MGQGGECTPPWRKKNDWIQKLSGYSKPPDIPDGITI